MECAACGHRNSAGARFCGECGAPIQVSARCPVCSVANPAGQNFCSSCGADLRAGAPGGAVRPPPDLSVDGDRPVAAGDGERKQVTVLFADVMGSMELAESCDPEDWQQLMERFFSILSEGVHRFEGTVDKFTGDGIMALFGAPVAHEDHAQRACLAALRMTDRLAEFSAELRRVRGLNFLVRIGLNSGEVVVGEIGEEGAIEYTAVGHTVGLAQRMESLAEPGKAYLTDSTAALVDGYVTLKDLGEFEVKGSSRPLRVHELTGVGPARGRLDVSRARGFARFVGREAEMAVLEDAFAQAVAGEGRVIGIVGEPGVGKSRLCHEFAQGARSRGVPVYYTAGQAHTSSVPLVPVMRLMRTYFEIDEADSEERARERIAGRLLMLDESLVEAMPLIFDFLSVDDSSRPPPRLDPEARRRQLLAVMKRLIRAQSAERPGVNLFEDLHWIDPASESFLATHVDAVQGTSSLTIVNFRPEYHARWMSKPYYSQIALTALNQEAITEMLADLLGGDPSLRELPATLGQRTDGNPFFIEEMLQELIEEGNLEGERGAFRLVRPLGGTAIPATVQVVLSARIDRLEPTQKRALHAASVIGKEFSASVLAIVLDCAVGGAGRHAARPRRRRLRLRAGGLSRLDLRLQAPADPGSRLRLAARRAPRRRPRRRRRGDRRAQPGPSRRAGGADRRSLGGRRPHPRSGPLERPRRPLERGQGRAPVDAALAPRGAAGRVAARVRGDPGAGVGGAGPDPPVRLAPRHLPRGSRRALPRGRSDGAPGPAT